MHHLTAIRLALLTALLAVAALGLIGIGAAASGAAATLSEADLAVFHIHDAVDVTQSAEQDLPSTGVSRAQAISVAVAEVGPGLLQTRVLHAMAPKTMDEPDRSVWVVLFAGGVIPFDGPDGAKVSPTGRITGVIVDDATGEFLSGFIR